MQRLRKILDLWFWQSIVGIQDADLFFSGKAFVFQNKSARDVYIQWKPGLPELVPNWENKIFVGAGNVCLGEMAKDYTTTMEISNEFFESLGTTNIKSGLLYEFTRVGCREIIP